MKEVKTKPSMKTAKVLDKAARIPRDAKAAFSKLKEKTQRDSDSYESPGDYAGQKITEKGGDTVRKTAEGVKSGARKAVEKARDRTRKSAYEGGKRHAEKNAAYAKRSNIRSTGNYSQAPKTAKKAVSPVKQKAARSAKTAKRTVKAASRSVKAAGRTVKTAGKAVKTTAKAAQAAKRLAIQAARAAARAARLVAKAVAAAIKAIIAAIKALIAAIAAGGWVAVLIIIIVAVVAAVLCSAFGLFYSNETEDGAPMTELISAIDTEYRAGIDAKIAELSAGDHEEIKAIYRGDGDGDSASVNNWNDVLAVYAVLTTTKQDDPTDVVVVSEANESVLREVFSVMNTASYDTAVQTDTITVTDEYGAIVLDENGEAKTTEKTTLYIYVELAAMSYEQGAEYYRFTGDQMEVLEEMMSPEYYSYYAALVGVDIYGGTNLTDVISGLPANSKGAEAVKAALTKLGAPYVWGAKGENKFDCSGLAFWAINEVDSALGGKLYTSAAGQAKYCYDNNLTVGRSELQPGDLVFWQNLGCVGCSRWQEIHHVGIYIGDGKVIEASSSKGRVVIREMWSTPGYPLYMFARPYA